MENKRGEMIPREEEEGRNTEIMEGGNFATAKNFKEDLKFCTGGRYVGLTREDPVPAGRKKAMKYATT